MRLSASEFAAMFPNHSASASRTKTQESWQQVVKKQSKQKKAVNLSARSHLEASFAQQLRAMNATAPVEEHQFAPPRKWAFDFAWPELFLAVEIEGGTHSRGRHVRPQGFQNDCEKYNEATRLGWRVLRYTAKDVKSGTAIDQTLNFLMQLT